MDNDAVSLAIITFASGLYWVDLIPDERSLQPPQAGRLGEQVGRPDAGIYFLPGVDFKI